jgi:hypothetical protein
LEIEKRYQVKFLEIGTDTDHVLFVVQSVPMYSVAMVVMLLKRDCGEVSFSQVTIFQVLQANMEMSR